MEREGTLEQELTRAGENALEELLDLEENGLRRHEANEIVLPKYILLPPETGESVPQED
jgi:hypothetical protein